MVSSISKLHYFSEGGALRQQWKVLKKLLVQSWIPALLALAYAVWDFSTSSQTRTAAGLVRSWGVAFFLIMWFVGQWFRASKQISDSEQLQSLQRGIDQSLTMLQGLVDATSNESPTVAAPGADGTPASTRPNEAPVARVLSELSKSPKGALLILGAEIERALRDLLWSSGWFQGVGKANITNSVNRLVELGVVSKNLGSSVRAFLEIRNRLLHGGGVTEDEVLRAIDIGLTILRAVLAVPCEQNQVYHPGVDVFEDEQANHLRSGIKAVILETRSPGGSAVTRRPFPTTRTNFTKGHRVSWEWNTKNVVGNSWYRDPDSGEIRHAWSQSAEFVGRDLGSL